MEKPINIVFLGGARRVTLAEQIQSISSSIRKVSLFSLERDEKFYPISSIATTVSAPSFKSEKFDEFLEEFLRKNSAIVLGCMDAAIPAIARLSGKNLGGGLIIGPQKEGAEVSLNKIKTSVFCLANNIRHPIQYTNSIKYEGDLIAKPIEGFGGKGIEITHTSNLEKIAALEKTHIIQEFIHGNETTHDIYITQNTEIIAASRDRLAVIDGEVDHCIVREPMDDEYEIFQKIASTGYFRGPITVQTIRNAANEVVLIEINARLGGGVTASIAAGLPIIEYFLEESLGIQLPRREFKKLEMKRARRDFYRFLT